MCIKKIFIDDVRCAPSDEWIIIRDSKSAINYFSSNTCPDIISFDHDLGEEDTGYDLLKWLIFYDMNKPYIKKDIIIICHSANPVGKINIEKYWESYKKLKEDRNLKWKE